MESMRHDWRLWEWLAEPSTREACQVDMLDRSAVRVYLDFACTAQMGHGGNLKPFEVAWPTSHRLLIGNGPNKIDCRQMVKAANQDVGRCSCPGESCHIERVWGRRGPQPSLWAGFARLTRHEDEAGAVGYSRVLADREGRGRRGSWRVESREPCPEQGTAWSGDVAVHVAIAGEAAKRDLALRSSCSHNPGRHSAYLCTATEV